MNYELRDKSQLNRGVVLVHDSITQLGGAERVVSVFHEMFRFVDQESVQNLV
jgi:hypothetical protein